MSFSPETKSQIAEWHKSASLRQKKVKMSKRKVKILLVVFFDEKTEIHKQFVPPEQITNSAYYVDVPK